MAKRDEYRKFLQQRGLTRSFNVWKSIKGKKKAQVELNLPNYDGYKRREKVLLVRQKNGTVIRNFHNLQRMGFSRSKDFSEVLKKLKPQKEVRFMAYGKELSMKEPLLKLKNRVNYSSYNTALMRRKVVSYSNYAHTIKGHIVAKVKFEKNDRVIVQEAHSRGGYRLHDKTQVRMALDEAIKNCFAAQEFTPDKWELVDWWYGSFTNHYSERGMVNV